MFNHCCVVTCDSRRKDVKLHMFPKTELGLQKWLECINCEQLRSLSFQDLRKQYVCRKHFETRFLGSNRERARLRIDAYPTLFTEREIASGIPDTERIDCECAASKKKVHSDHTYCRGETVNKCKKTESDEDCQKKRKLIHINGDDHSRIKNKQNLDTGLFAPKQSKFKRHLRSGGLNVPEIPLVALDEKNENLIQYEQDLVLSVNFSNNEDQICTDEAIEVVEATEIDMVHEVVKANKEQKKEIEKMLFNMWKQRDEKRLNLCKDIAKNMDDDIDSFCRHIGQVLRNLPVYEKAKAKKHLKEVLLDYEIMAAIKSS